MDGYSSLNGAKCKACGETLLVFEDRHTAMLVLQRTVQLLLQREGEGVAMYSTSSERCSL